MLFIDTETPEEQKFLCANKEIPSVQLIGLAAKKQDYVHQGGQREGTMACGMEQAEERPGAVNTGKS